MIDRFLLLGILFFLSAPPLLAQTDSVQSRAPAVRSYNYRYLDSTARARRIEIRDSLKAVGDSLSRIWIKTPDPNRPNKFADSLIKLYTVDSLDFKAWASKFSLKKNRFDEGKPRPKGETWVISV